MSRSLSRIANGDSAMFDRKTIFSYRKRPTGDKRTVYVNERPPKDQFDHRGRYIYKFATNEIRTTKYTLTTFLPKNLFEQFRRIANFFFLGMVILQFFPQFQSAGSNPFYAAVPIFVIVGISAAKDAFEDLRRRRSDASINSTRCLVCITEEGNMNYIGITRSLYQSFVRSYRKFFARNYRKVRAKLAKQSAAPEIDMEMAVKTRKPRKSRAIGQESDIKGTEESIQPVSNDLESNPLPGVVQNKETTAVHPDPIKKRATTDDSPPVWRQEKWKNLRVGDIIKLRNNESIPADIVILSTSEPDCVCYIETKNLDGETNLKIRSGFKETGHLQTPADIQQFQCRIDTEAPNTNLYNFNGVLHLPTKETQNTMAQFEHESPHLKISHTVVPININQMLPRGCLLRNTDWIIGVVVFTGNDTKLIQNSGETPSKRSRIEIQMNPQVVANFVLLVILCFVIAIMNGVYLTSSAAFNAPFNPASINTDVLWESFYTFWASMILLQNIVPISLYVTTEIVKLAQAYFLYHDIELYYEPYDVPCVPKSWAIADDLGQIEYLFSDKTGTLTRNVMEFRKCCIGGVVYGGYQPQEPEEPASNDSEPKPLKKKDKSESQSLHAQSRDSLGVEKSEVEASIASLQSMIQYMDKFYQNPYMDKDKLTFVDPKFARDLLHVETDQHKLIKEFFTHLAVCHTVIAEYPDDDDDFLIDYKAQSPDEAALVATAKNVGFTFIERIQDEVTVNILGEFVKFQTLDIIEFNSSRKRMSVIVRSSNGSIILYCKGADSVIYERLGDGFDDLKKKTLENLEAFATEGLRTLCLGYRVLSEEEYESWSKKYREAAASIVNREKNMDKIAEEVERHLVLLGATAIEDQLQQGVPECIARLAKGGIKIWVLTGDKMETAINIGFSCNLLMRDMVLVVVKGSSTKSTKNQLTRALKRCFDLDANLLLGADPERQEEDVEISVDADDDLQITSPMEYRETKKYALIIDGHSLKHALDKDCSKLFIELACRCSAVICCRVSPLQKAQVVRAVKKEKETMTLAIGDGANDVSMIQEAHIGIGIQGQEGMQAVMASDYAIAQFRFLNRLLLVHGRWSYFRTAEMTLLMFYKNFVWTIALLWYQFYCAFSGSLLFDYFFILFYNLIFTGLPAIVIGIFDQDISDKFSLAVPQVYQLGIAQEYYSMRLFLWYVLDGLYQSVICFYVGYFVVQEGVISANGRDASYDVLGTAVAVYGVVVANLYVGFETKYWNWIAHVCYWGSTILFFLFFIIYSYFDQSSLSGIVPSLLGTPVFWLSIPLAIIGCMLPRYLVSFIRAWRYPNDVDIMREIEKYKLEPVDSLVDRYGERRPSAMRVPPTDETPGIIITDSSESAPKSAVSDLTNKLNAGIDRLFGTHLRRSFSNLQKAPALLFMKTGSTKNNRGFAFSQEPGVAKHLFSLASPTAGTLRRRREAGKSMSGISRDSLPLPLETNLGGDQVAAEGTQQRTSIVTSAHSAAPPFWQQFPFQFSAAPGSPSKRSFKSRSSATSSAAVSPALAPENPESPADLSLDAKTKRQNDQT